MELNEYQAEAMKTKKEWPDKRSELTDGILGVCGEAGEVAEIIKKGLSGVKFEDELALKKEIGDVLWYLTEICTTLGYDLQEIADINLEKLRKRHGEKFSGYGDRSGGGK